ncbi:MAG: SAM-dependent methyltransferase [Sterolibacteriaceae bacterium]|uniref:SAM-dependent methyltransferase n=1 Tax=Candidatus Methylophosphatis roskildensis TaxID=2899263 RepID=A0A9D7E1Y8_9PROT|nr:SAM-dependent methyltransferase [Candidatus Methylophosphatis roskildensis]
MKNAELPLPDPTAAASSMALVRQIRAEIAATGGWMPFARYMELALYAPMLGYYSGGARKFGRAGDFVTAPELTPLFAQTLAPVAETVMAESQPQILEFGAGTGRLAADLLAELARHEQPPDQYCILDLSGELRERQYQTLRAQVPKLIDRVTWLDRLPTEFEGLMLGNEVLDAMPVHLMLWSDDEILERGVVADADVGLRWADRLATGQALDVARRLPVAQPYLSEVALAGSAWVAQCGRMLTRGALLLFDYGFSRAEFYHPQRNTGTLMCHYRHHAHTDPLWLPGLNDITAHVDFTSLAEVAVASGLEMGGYTSQAAFLMECGLLDNLAATGPTDSVDYLRAAAQVQKLLSPTEMGELFKVIGFTRELDAMLPGFARGDRSHTL